MSVAWFFPGQGSQAVGMGKDFFLESAAARAVWAETDDALGEKLSRLVFEGPESELTLTANAQPAIVATSAAILAVLRERFPELPTPVYGAGHSLGEYSALVATGALSLADAVKTVRARGLAMQEAVAADVGAMAAVMGLSAERVAEVCAEAAGSEVVSPANFNAPGQVVIAGHAGAVQRAREIALKSGGKVIPLKVSAPFHCSLMAPAAKRVAEVLSGVTFHPFAFPIVANFAAKPNADPSEVRDLLVRQVEGTVRWEESVRFIREQGVTHALEIGPGKVLGVLARRIAKDLKALSVESVGALAEVEAFLASAPATGTTIAPPAGSIPPPTV